MQLYHIYPDIIMKDLPGYVSKEAPMVFLPEDTYAIIKEILENAFAYCRSQGATHLTLEDIFKIVSGSLIYAGISKEEMRRIMNYATTWFVTHSNDWLTTMNPETGRIWLASLRIPEHL